MPTDLEGVHVFKDAQDPVTRPGKAANAGGVAVSGLEMSQNSERRIAGRRPSSSRCCATSWTASTTAAWNMARKADGYVDYVKGANIAGFKKVADAMLAFGVV